MNRIPSVLSALALAAVALTTGCTSFTPNRMEIPAQGNTSLLIDNEGLQDDVVIQGGRCLYEGDIMLGIITVKDDTDDDIDIQHRWKWYDTDGVEMVAGGEGRWELVHLKALEEKQLQGRATRPGATKAVFEMRYYRKNNEGDR